MEHSPTPCVSQTKPAGRVPAECVVQVTSTGPWDGEQGPSLGTATAVPKEASAPLADLHTLCPTAVGQTGTTHLRLRTGRIQEEVRNAEDTSVYPRVPRVSLCNRCFQMQSATETALVVCGQEGRPLVLSPSEARAGHVWSHCVTLPAGPPGRPCGARSWLWGQAHREHSMNTNFPILLPQLP